MPTNEQDRRYPELYSHFETEEANGRHMKTWCWSYSLLTGPVSGILAYLVGTAFSGVGESFLGWAVGMAVGIVTVPIVYVIGYNKVLRAQQMLILVDTEQHSRRAADSLEEIAASIKPPANNTPRPWQ